jgi:hypothetical protein
MAKKQLNPEVFESTLPFLAASLRAAASETKLQPRPTQRENLNRRFYCGICGVDVFSTENGVDHDKTQNHLAAVQARQATRSR